MGGNLQELMKGMSIDQKNNFEKQQTDLNSYNSKKVVRRIRWCWLPDVRKILDPGSAMGTLVENKLN